MEFENNKRKLFERSGNGQPRDYNTPPPSEDDELTDYTDSEISVINQNILNRLRPIVSRILEVDIDDVQPNAKLKKHLGMDEIGSVELVMECEKEFNIQIPDKVAAPLEFADVTLWVKVIDSLIKGEEVKIPAKLEKKAQQQYQKEIEREEEQNVNMKEIVEDVVNFIDDLRSDSNDNYEDKKLQETGCGCLIIVAIIAIVIYFVFF